MMFVELCVGAYGLIRYKFLNTPLRYLVWTIIFWFAAGITERIMGVYRIHNLWFIQCNNLIGLALVTRIYYSWRTSRRNGVIILVNYLCFVVLWIIAKFTFEPILESDDITFTISSIIILATAMYTMIQLLRQENIVLKDDPRFWTSAAFIIYSTGTFLIFSMFAYLLHSSKDILFILYPINWILIIISHLFYARAFFCPQASAGTIHQTTNTIRG
jgi:hypothetical protein